MIKFSPKPRNLVLVGFMGVGKTTVAHLLASRLGLLFMDTDTVIETETGADIPTLFSTMGEKWFRTVEAEIIQRVANGYGQVIATGGGALGNPKSLAALLEDNFVVWLRAPLECSVKRVVEQGHRPLLEGAQALVKAKALYSGRIPLYAQAHLVVGSDTAPQEVCTIIADKWRLAIMDDAPLETIPIELGERSYMVTVGAGLLTQIPQLIPLPAGPILVITDTNVGELYAQTLIDGLKSAGWQPTLHVFPAGEEHKNLQTLNELYTACASANLERTSPILALGGGVVGDATGFAAASYLRGVPFIQVPTTLLAQVDSSVGGKVAVNLPEGKNLIGAFHQPRAVIADVTLLTSLPKRELLSGLAEVIKHGVIADAELFSFIEENLDAILSRNSQALTTCVTRSCEIKGRVVQADERESDRREVLNFGHTVGHAVEVVSGYGTYTHGEAVAIGMVTAARLSHVHGLGDDELHRLIRLLRRAGLPVCTPELSIHALLAAMKHDKKARQGEIRFVLVPSIGKVMAGLPVESALIEDTLEWQNTLS